MHIFYPYNEHLPKKSAHDVFLFQECAALAMAGVKTTLLIGKGSQPKERLEQHYLKTTLSKNVPLEVEFLPLIRKNNFLNLSWNWPFFHHVQKRIETERPDIVLLSVLKQGSYHLQRKVPGVRYVYEVHQLEYYPNRAAGKHFLQEKKMLSQADLIVVTTQALKEILQQPPYALAVPIEVVSLGVDTEALPPSNAMKETISLGYVGQLYAAQGLPFLLQGLKEVPSCSLTVVGGNPQTIAPLQAESARLGIQERVHFTGFIPPQQLPQALQEIDCFIAPFSSQGRMPYVAHTKLLEYRGWKRPFIAPDLPVTREHCSEADGALFYRPDHLPSFIEALQQVKKTLSLLKAQALQSRAPFSLKERALHYKELLSSLLPLSSSSHPSSDFIHEQNEKLEIRAVSGGL